MRGWKEHVLGMGCRGIIGSAMGRNRNRTIEEFLRGKVVKGRLYVCVENYVQQMRGVWKRSN